MSRRAPEKAAVRRKLKVFLPAVSLLVIAGLTALVTLVYRVMHPEPAAEPIDPSAYRLSFEDVSWAGAGMELHGWLISGRRGAPAILLVPGYGMSRASVLSLASSLQQKGFHLLTFDQRGSGIRPRGMSTLGLRERDDVRAALNFLSDRPEIDGTRLGIWGVDVGAWAALEAAAGCEQVLAVVADSAYPTVADFLDLRIREITGGSFRLIESVCRLGFMTCQFVGPETLHERIPVDDLAGRRILFISGKNRPALAKMTFSLYEALTPGAEMLSLETSRVRVMGGSELEDYDKRVSDFFVRSLAGKPPLKKAEERYLRSQSEMREAAGVELMESTSRAIRAVEGWH